MTVRRRRRASGYYSRTKTMAGAAASDHGRDCKRRGRGPVICKPTAIVLLTVLGLTAFATAAPGQQGASLSFSEEQAKYGEQVYQAHCQACHGSDLAGGPGGPSLSDRPFRGRWQVQTAGNLLAFIREKMPLQAPGSLSDRDYASVMAHILRANGAKPGTVGLPATPDQLAATPLAGAWPAVTAVPKAQPIGERSTIVDASAKAVLSRRTAKLGALRSVTEEMLRTPPAEDWLHWRRTYDAQGFSPLRQIDRGNASRLTVAWSWELASGKNEITPLVHDGVIFIPSSGQLEALDAATGDLLWQYRKPGVTEVERNLAISGDLIFMGANENVVAVNMRDGKAVWDRQITAPENGLSFRAGPLVAKGKVMMGVAGCASPYPGGCFIVALDALNGREAWRFNTLARPGQVGGDSWNGASTEQRTGGSVWTAGSYDPDLDLVYFGVGQTYRTALLLQGGTGKSGSTDGLFTDTTLALRPETGELVWHYQHMPREVWDLDWAFERTLATMTINGAPRRTVTTGGKIAIFDTLDAATGRYLFSYDAGIQNLVASIDPKTGAKHVAPQFKSEPDVVKQICPSAGGGGRNWPSTSYNPITGVMFIPTNETCMPFVWSPGSSMDMQLFPRPRTDSDGMIGRVQAVDMATRKTLWIKRERAPHSSAVLATGGGLVFEGSRDRWFRARDDRTGEVLWQVRLNAPPSSFPITYSVAGVQYVAVTTGGGGFYDVSGGSLAPEVRAPATGTTLWVFRLPSTPEPSKTSNGGAKAAAREVTNG